MLLAEGRGGGVAFACIRRGRTHLRNSIVKPLELHRARISGHGHLREDHGDNAEQADEFAGEMNHNDHWDLDVTETFQRHNS